MINNGTDIGFMFESNCTCDFSSLYSMPVAITSNYRSSIHHIVLNPTEYTTFG